jgi:2-polyprenyl-3-methyl-5-hydroxy-6-metoxy-1,4-benzoquinol methylase
MSLLSATRTVISATIRPFGYRLVKLAPLAQPQQFHHINAILAEAESVAAKGDFDSVLTVLQRLPLSDFGWLLMAPPPQYMTTLSLLPSMASKEVQLSWTGAQGAQLLQQSLLFAKSLEAAFPRLTGRSLHNATMLDFGCGWGRLIRLMLWFSHPDKIFGVDAWERSLELCADHRVPGSLAQCDRVVKNLPFNDQQFDLIYAFSVFTHLSEEAAMAAQSAIRQRIKTDGLFVITIRPEEFWLSHPIYADSERYGKILEQHRALGFAFVRGWGDIGDDPEGTYGDTSISFDYLQKKWGSWQVCGYDHNFEDSMQIIVFLKPI